MEKIRKNKQSQIFKFLLGGEGGGGCPTSSHHIDAINVSCSMMVHSFETLGGIIYITRFDTSRNYSQ